MFRITYHLKDPQLRKRVDLTDYRSDLLYTANQFTTVQLLQVTPRDYTVLVKVNENWLKNRIVRAFGSEFASISYLGEEVDHREGSSTLFVAKKVEEV
jgi:hypothetical protein